MSVNSPLFTIADAFKYILITDYAKYMEQVCDILNRGQESSFKDYVEAVMFDPASWFNSFPEKLKSSSALGKPKTAMLNLLKHEQVIKSLGKDFCKEASTEISNYWKKTFKIIIDGRLQPMFKVADDQNSHQGSNAEVIEDSEEGMDEEVDEVIPTHLQQNCASVEVLKLHNKRLSETVNTQQTKIERLENTKAVLENKNEVLRGLLYKYVQKVHESDNIAIEMYTTLIRDW
jgi:hypothetical protein